MLKIRMLSAEEMSIPVAEILDVKALKRHLNQLRGFPLGCRQRFLLHGDKLGDAVELDPAMELDLVLLEFAEVSPARVDDLIAAAAQGSKAEVQSGLQLPQNPNLSREDGRTALMAASEAGHIEIVNLLLQAGANTDVADVHGHTALMFASVHGHVEVVGLLLEAGADKDVANGNSITALMWASWRGHMAVVNLLLDVGANKNAAHTNGQTALMWASGTGHVEIVSLLLSTVPTRTWQTTAAAQL